MKKIAVLLSHYNGDKYIKEQIDSILTQEIPSEMSVSLFVRDDGSTKSDLSILKEYQDNDRLTLIIGENVGVKLSFYDLMSSVSNYDYYFFSDQDDIWSENKISVMVNQLELWNSSQEPVGIFSDLWIANQDGQPTGQLMKHESFKNFNADSKKIHQNILKYYMVTGASFAFNELARQLAVSLGKSVFQATRMHDATMAFILVASGKLLYFDEPLVYYRQHGDNVIGYTKQLGLLYKIRHVKNLFDEKSNKIFDMYIINKKLPDISDKRFYVIEKMMTKSVWQSPYYAWKLRYDIFGKKVWLSLFLFLIFGTTAIHKFQNILRKGL
ncbi:glycosyltransferase [Leuconostoc citreum]|uniref:glycosyltransferase n=1 Tax=Leuconostoc citreum TaxID=33964 RepID=UPI001C1F26E2|nr:glycosyltransferase [Leuconostoc citreum]MBU7449878.1 glycosyltransferase [Leuconostoc citreum]